MPIPLKVFSDDDPEPGRLYVGLPVTLPESTDDDMTLEDVLVQPQIPDRMERIAAIEREVRLRRAKTEPQPEDEQ